MLKNTLLLATLMIMEISFCQSIDVNPVGAPESNETIPELINSTLTDNCSNGQNITYRFSNTVGGAENSYGYFNYSTMPSLFPFNEGIILSTGKATDAEGPNDIGANTGTGGNTIGESGVINNTSWLGDSDIEEILNERFGDTFPTNNATIIEFDFVPLTNTISFDYIFASEEWESGAFECPGQTFQDGFAFIITGPGITQDLKPSNGLPFAHGGKNIALISGTNIPVSVGTIYNNPGCVPPMSNEGFYVSYTGAAAANSPIQYNARTVKLTAQETVVAGQTYHLKLVVADRGDDQFDSAVFLEANSFSYAPTLTIDGTELENTAVLCEGGSSITIDGTVDLPNISGAIDYQWLHNGVEMPGENTSQLTTNTNGEYILVATLPASTGDCDATSDPVTISFLPETTIGNAPDLRACDLGDGTGSFQLDDNSTILLDGQSTADFSVSYHLTQEDADTGANPLPIPYIGEPIQIFARVIRTVDPTFCLATTTFNLILDTVPTTTQPATPIIRICDDLANGVNQESFDLTQFQDEVLNGQLLSNVTITYHISQNDADNDTNPILTPTGYLNTANPQTIYIRVDNSNNNDCYATTTIQLFTDLIPIAQQPTEMRACDDEDAATGDIIGEETFDLTIQNTVILGGLLPADYTIDFYIIDNTNTQIPIANPTTYAVQAPITSQEVFATVSNNSNTSCTSTISFFIFRDLIYTSAETPENLTLALCDDNNPGDLTESFNLDTLTPLIFGATVTATEATVSYHILENDAINDINPIAPTNAYVSGTTTIYYRIENNINSTCVSTGEIQLVVNPLPEIIAPTDPFTICDTDTIDGLADFDFNSTLATNIINEITQGNTNYIVSFFENITDAQNNTNPLPAVYTNTTANAQTIHVRVEDITTNCVSLTTLDLEVLGKPAIFFPNPLIECDGDNDGHADFTLTDAVAEITNNDDTLLVYFYDSQPEAASGPSEFTPLPDIYENINEYSQTIYVRVENAAGCFDLTTLELIVLDKPVLPENLIYTECDDTLPNDGLAVFNLDARENTELLVLVGNPNDYIVTYYTGLDLDGNPTGQFFNTGAYPNISNPQTIYASVISTLAIDSDGNGCEAIKEITLRVDNLPNVTPAEYILCDDDYWNDWDGLQEFDLLGFIVPNMIASIDGINVSFFEVDTLGNMANQIPDSDLRDYENTLGNPQDIQVLFENQTTGCSIIGFLKLTVLPNPTPLEQTDISNMSSCENDGTGPGTLQEGYALFDFTDQTIAIVDSEPGVSLTFHTNINDAEAGLNAIPNIAAYYNSIPFGETIYVRDTNDTTGCYTIVQFDITVPVPSVTIEGASILCLDKNGVPLADASPVVLTAIANSIETGPFNYQWSLNGVNIPGATGETLTVSQPGDYSVTVSGPLDISCVNFANHTVTVSAEPEGFEANVTTNAFAGSHQIVATATSSIPGVVFQFGLDVANGGEFGTSGIFNDVTPGIHIVSVTDGTGCWQEDITVAVIDYPHFFTPNGDGYNDTWQITGITGIPISHIYIFDRFGKLLKQVDPDSKGWDGTYKGSPLPATDYWFKIIYIEGDNTPTEKEFKAHFSLKR